MAFGSQVYFYKAMHGHGSEASASLTPTKSQRGIHERKPKNEANKKKEEQRRTKSEPEELEVG